MAGKGPIAASTATPFQPPFPLRDPPTDPSDKEWAIAIVMHSNMFHSPVWPIVYPKQKGIRLLSGVEPCDYLVSHQIASGMSFGVFDAEYKFKRPESVPTGGALYWSELADSPDATSDDFLSRMDFPLVSIALAYDGINAFDMAQIVPLVAVLPLFGTFYHQLELADRRPRIMETHRPEPSPHAQRHGHPPDYEGKHIMANLARFLMREAKIKGFRGIQIECAHDAVTHVWSNPPEPFQGEIISTLDSKTFEEEQLEGEGGKKEKVLVFAPSEQVFTKVFVTL